MAKLNIITTVFSVILLFAPLVHGSSIPIPRPTGPNRSSGKVCTLMPLGPGHDDVPQIVRAFDECNNGGTVVFPSGQTFYIATKLNPVLTDVTIEWRGIWKFSDDMQYWRDNAYPIAFQNHHAGFVVTGERVHINGHGTGGIDGNANKWYTTEAGTSRIGRPMPFVFWNTTDVFVEHFFVKDPALWAVNVMNGANMWFDDIDVNATAISAPRGANWVQNTDGFDTMDSYNIVLTNFVYQGNGDDAVAIKPRSYNIYCQNITIHGGNGVAIGSLGQYLEDSSVVNVVVKDVKLMPANNDLRNSAYIKTWVGEQTPQTFYESAGLPRGGGWGIVNNIRFENFEIIGGGGGPTISQDSGNNGSFSGTSNLLVSNIAFVNFAGYTSGSSSRTASILCSSRNPCYNIDMKDVKLGSNNQANSPRQGATGTCRYIEPGGVHGMTGSGC